MRGTNCTGEPLTRANTGRSFLPSRRQRMSCGMPSTSGWVSPSSVKRVLEQGRCRLESPRVTAGGQRVVEVGDDQERRIGRDHVDAGDSGGGSLRSGCLTWPRPTAKRRVLRGQKVASKMPSPPLVDVGMLARRSGRRTSAPSQLGASNERKLRDSALLPLSRRRVNTRPERVTGPREYRRRGRAAPGPRRRRTEPRGERRTARKRALRHGSGQRRVGSGKSS